MRATRSSPSGGPVEPHEFDPLSFLKYVKNIGRAYRKRATELVSICRLFMRGQRPTCDSVYDLRSVLELVDNALMSATLARKGTSKEADKAFESAVRGLDFYEQKHHRRKTVVERIEVAEKADKSSLKFFNKLIENFHSPKEEPTIKVEFLLHKSLPDNKPVVVPQALCRSSHINEILWNLSRPRKEAGRVTLRQNPHFYDVLPISPDKYGDNFLMRPIENYNAERDKRVSVLTDNLSEAGRVFLKTKKKTRAFGNVWVPKNAIIFKDVCGDLEGERRVSVDIEDTPNLMCFTEAPPPRASLSSPLSDRSSISSTTTGTPTTSSTGLLLTDWREPIRRMSLSSDVNIHISTKPPSKSIRSCTSPSSPFSQYGFNSSAGSLPPTDSPQSQSRFQLPISEPPPAGLSQRSPARASPDPPGRSSSKPPACPSPDPPGCSSPEPPAHRSAKPAARPPPPPEPPAHPKPLTHPPPEPTARPSSDPSVKSPPQPTAVPAPQPHNTGVRSSDHSVTSSQTQVLNTVTPHTESREAKVNRHVPSQRPDPGHQHGVTPKQLPPEHIQPGVPTLQAPDPQAQKRRKNWFQKYVYDYGQ